MIKIINKSKNVLEYKTSKSACFDISANDFGIIHPGGWKAVATGLYIEQPIPPSPNTLTMWSPAQVLYIKPRSGLALRYSVTVLNAPGVVDEDYPDEIKVILINHSKEPYFYKLGDRIAQGNIEVVLRPDYIAVNSAPRTGGFGSSGV